MDFTWSESQIELRAEARVFALDAVSRYGRQNDSWINGYSKELARELGARGWIGMTWPVEHGGGGRPLIDRLIVGEELIAAGAPIAAMWFADRQMGPSLIAHGTESLYLALNNEKFLEKNLPTATPEAVSRVRRTLRDHYWNKPVTTPGSTSAPAVVFRVLHQSSLRMAWLAWWSTSMRILRLPLHGRIRSLPSVR